MELGKKIRQLRFKAGMTQEQLAEQLGISPQSVSKWENAVAMPDISTLPLLAEVFGVTIDDLFDLTAEQRFNRIEHRMDIEDELPQDVFLEYEEFLKSQVSDRENKKRATELLAYLYWHRMEMFGQKASRCARDCVRMSPNEKGSQWILQKAEGHAAWDWNISNHTKAIEFYKELLAEGRIVLLPLVTGRGAMEAVRLPSVDTLVPDAFDILTVEAAHRKMFLASEIDCVSHILARTTLRQLKHA